MPKKKLSIIQRLFGKVRIKERFGDEPKYIVAEIPIWEREISRVRRASVVRLVRKAEKILKNAGAGVVLTAESCREYSKYLKEVAIKSYSIPKTRMFEGFWAAFQKVGSDVLKSVLIIDAELASASYERVKDLCPFVGKITIRTDEVERAEEIAERLFAEYGICVQVNKVGDVSRGWISQAVVDVDNARIRVGDFCVDGAEFISKSGEYKTDPAEEAAYLGKENMLDVDGWISGKRIIKIS